MSVKKIIGGIVASGMLMAALTVGSLGMQPVAAAPVDEVTNGVTAIGGSGSADDLPNFIKTIINVLLFVIGAVAVIMIIIGGIRYVTSNGEQAHVKAAKDTILYAVVGLVVALLAYAIVNFVLGSVK